MFFIFDFDAYNSLDFKCSICSAESYRAVTASLVILFFKSITKSIHTVILKWAVQKISWQVEQVCRHIQPGLAPVYVDFKKSWYRFISFLQWPKKNLVEKFGNDKNNVRFAQRRKKT